MTDPHVTASTPSVPGGVDPRPRAVVAELDRIARRFQELPIDRAEAAQDVVRAAFARLLPDSMPLPPALGPAVTVDQLRVLTFDACRRVATDDLTRRAEIREILVEVRRALP